jgi:site-specific DNA recombinase
MKKVNAIIYARVSTDEQAIKGYSLESQEAAGKAHCKINDYKVVAIYSEDYSAKTFDDRPEWKKIMQYIKVNRGVVNRIVFLKWDRFSRNSYEAIGMIKTLQKLNVVVDCIEQPLDINNPDNLLLMNIYTAVPEIENAKISSRTISGMRQASLNGCWVGKVPFGYDRSWKETIPVQKDATLTPNSNSSVVQDIFRYYTVESMSSDAVRNAIYSKYKIKFSKQGILHILKNIGYTGKVRVKAYKDEPERVVVGYHKPIITDEIFFWAQNNLNGKKRKHIRKDNSEAFPLKEIIKCSVCSLSYTASITTKNAGKNKYPYYHCSKTKGHDRYPVDVVHNCFDELLKEFRVKDEIRDLYYAVLVDTINDYNKVIIDEKYMIEKQVEVVKKRIHNIENKIADYDGYDSSMMNMLSRFREEESELIMRHAALKAEATPKPMDIDYLMELFNSMYLIYLNSDFAMKKRIVGSIFPKSLYFFKDHFRTELVSPLLELLILNSNNLRRLKIETSHLKSGSSSKAPPAGLEPATL